MLHVTTEVMLWITLVVSGLVLNVISHREISLNLKSRKSSALPPEMKAAAMDILLTERLDESGRTVALAFALGAGLVAPFLRPVLSADVAGPSLGQVVSWMLLLMLASLDLSAGLSIYRQRTRIVRLTQDAEAQIRTSQHVLAAGPCTHDIGAVRAQAVEDIGAAREQARRDIDAAREQATRDIIAARAEKFEQTLDAVAEKVSDVQPRVANIEKAVTKTDVAVKHQEDKNIDLEDMAVQTEKRLADLENARET